MRVTDSFKLYVLEQLGDMPELKAKNMFGGVGIYSEGKFFAVIDDDKVYFKVGEENINDFLERGSRPFEPVKGQVMKNYYELPADILDNREKLIEWAKKSANIPKR